MEFTRVNRSGLVGATKSRTAVIESLIHNNALNRTSTTNYNADGVEDEIGFVNVTEKFVECWCLITILNIARMYLFDRKTKVSKNS